MSTPTRHLKWIGANVSKREAERSRLERKVKETARMFEQYGDHTSEIAHIMAVEALARFEDGEA